MACCRALCRDVKRQRSVVAVFSSLHILYGVWELFHRRDKALQRVDNQPDFQHYETSANLIGGIFGLVGSVCGLSEFIGGLLACQIVAVIDYVWAIIIIDNCNPEIVHGPCVPYVEDWDRSAIALYILGVFGILVAMLITLLTLCTMRRQHRQPESLKHGMDPVTIGRPPAV
mmetsp:Transcript_9707/g.21725  ORF Transcript_9707/g.21725 Transcript_9707/m.21725 type:complete len:172 (+) Transcript_9707:120-635(+)|eukprot:CAMPEP_0170581184 /NCGR_PEP_ID=MMETSP0224-20130122/6904_1 /TAXON_ID=285029 /ORGANISM="Togula jolla, Strain CCCM 725" /LENGTH=171 /DNA_ID=CAMNT_0010904303 /DNA_START=39 /DNA_END=554 /DNA_ORIENTATION=+